MRLPEKLDWKGLKYIVVHLGFKLHALMHEDGRAEKKHVPGNV
jgi:hypothetical protein